MMVERREIVRRWEAGARGVLVTLVGVHGSSYRRPGARLLITGGEGEAMLGAGSISGGCLEADLVRRAGWLVRAGAAVEHYSTAFDDLAEMPFGLGCGGELDCLLEPLGTAECEALLGAMRRSLAGEAMRVVTRLPGAGGALARVVLDGAGAVAFRSDGLGHDAWASAGPGAVEVSRPGEGAAGVFGETLEAPQRLWVLGAGADAQPLVRMASLLGWTVRVADGRAHLARAERFPEAEQVVALGAGEAPAVAAADAVVLMTHSFEQDRQLLGAVLPVGPRYLGLLGARHRSALLLQRTAEALGWPLAQVCAAVRAPVGLDLGGDGPEAVALSVVGEVQAVCQGRPAGVRELRAEEVEQLLLLHGGVERMPVPAMCGLDLI